MAIGYLAMKNSENWISIKDSMPQLFQSVIVRNIHGFTTIAHYGYKDSWETIKGWVVCSRCKDDGVDLDIDVVEWARLPKGNK